MVPRRAVAGRSRQRRLLGNAVLNISELWHGAADVAKAVKIHRHSASRSQPAHGSASSGACSADGGLSAAAPNALLHVGARPLGVFPTVRRAWPCHKPTAQCCTRSPRGAAELDSGALDRAVMAGIALDAATTRHAPSVLAITPAAKADRCGVDHGARAAGRRANSRVGRAQVCAAITLGGRRCAPAVPAASPACLPARHHSAGFCCAHEHPTHPFGCPRSTHTRSGVCRRHSTLFRTNAARSDAHVCCAVLREGSSNQAHSTHSHRLRTRVL